MSSKLRNWDWRYRRPLIWARVVPEWSGYVKNSAFEPGMNFANNGITEGGRAERFSKNNELRQKTCCQKFDSTQGACPRPRFSFVKARQLESRKWFLTYRSSDPEKHCADFAIAKWKHCLFQFPAQRGHFKERIFLRHHAHHQSARQIRSQRQSD